MKRKLLEIEDTSHEQATQAHEHKTRSVPNANWRIECKTSLRVAWKRSVAVIARCPWHCTTTRHLTSRKVTSKGHNLSPFGSQNLAVLVGGAGWHVPLHPGRFVIFISTTASKELLSSPQESGLSQLLHVRQWPACQLHFFPFLRSNEARTNTASGLFDTRASSIAG